MLSDTTPVHNSDPGYLHYAVTPSDADPIRADETPCRALYVGTGGDAVLVDQKGHEVLYKNIPSGAVLAFRAVRVNATNTTAADIVAWY